MKRIVCSGSAFLVAAACFVGCGKKEAPIEAPVAETPAPAAQSAEPKTETPVAAAPQETQAAPDTNLEPVSNPTIAMADEATRRKEYDKAAVVLLQMQYNTKLTEQQAWAAKNKMKDLQRELAQAAANGDPRAQQAINLLRSTTPR